MVLIDFRFIFLPFLCFLSFWDPSGSLPHWPGVSREGDGMGDGNGRGGVQRRFCWFSNSSLIKNDYKWKRRHPEMILGNLESEFRVNNNGKEDGSSRELSDGLPIRM